MDIAEDTARAYIDGRNAGRSAERARIRRELTDFLSDLWPAKPYIDVRQGHELAEDDGREAVLRAVTAAVNRIVPEDRNERIDKGLVRCESCEWVGERHSLEFGLNGRGRRCPRCHETFTPSSPEPEPEPSRSPGSAPE